MLYIFTPKFAQIGVEFCTLYLHKVLKSRYPYYSYTMLGIESKIADAQWNQMYAHSPPNSHRPAALPPHPNQRQRAKNNPKKEMHKNGIKCTPHTAVSPSPQNQRGIKNNFLVLLNSKIPSPFSALQP
jgi:hypothetical protein